MATRLIRLLPLLALGACATVPSVPDGERYTARGQEPGWAITIAGGRIDYVGITARSGSASLGPTPEPPSTVIAMRRRG
jgi:hypothetical protein